MLVDESIVDGLQQIAGMKLVENDPKSKPRTFSAEDARQGEIILRTRTRRIIFIAGLVGLVVLTVLLQLAR